MPFGGDGGAFLDALGSVAVKRCRARFLQPRLNGGPLFRRPSFMRHFVPRDAEGCTVPQDQPMPTARRILIVEDDNELCESLVEHLSLHEEFAAVTADTGTKGVQATKNGQIDLVIMDLGLPDLDGHEAVRIMRKNAFMAPIIILTGHDTDSDTILGLNSGANDYVVKPFRFAVLLARIRAQLRQHEASEDAVFNVGPYTFRPSSKILLGARNNKVHLTGKETAILRYLLRAGPQPISREVLLHEVWGYNSGVTTHTLETHIYRLRQKVEEDATSPTMLVTEPGGYKLNP